ncbi:MAG: thioredoxin domain-containing protein [Caulobacterales bacterium]
MRTHPLRQAAVLVVALALGFGLAACQKSGPDTSADVTIGSPTAKVSVIEYASLGCPHCARWNNEVFPLFKAKYIDTGRVRYIAREALTGDTQIAAAGFLLAHCAGKDKFFQVTDAVYHQQLDMYQPGASPHDILLKIGESAGLTQPQFEACVGDDAALKALNARVAHNSALDKITGTPTYIINGKTYEHGEMSMADLDKAIAEAEAGAK